MKVNLVLSQSEVKSLSEVDHIQLLSVNRKKHFYSY